jgi:hypothetical protein
MTNLPLNHRQHLQLDQSLPQSMRFFQELPESTPNNASLYWQQLQMEALRLKQKEVLKQEVKI